MRDLNTGPPKLEETDEQRIVGQFDPQFTVIADKTGVEYEWKTARNTYGSDQMPDLPPSIATDEVIEILIRSIADQRSGYGVRHLACNRPLVRCQ